jgi:hypothetical protein
VEVAVVNIRQTHPDLERRDVDVYIKPGNPLAAAPGLFLIRRATLLARATLLKTNTTQVILSDDAAIPTGDEVPWPVVDWYVHDALGVARPTGVLALGNWPTLAGHLQLLAEDPPPVVLGHLGEMDAADLQTKTLKAMQDSIHPCLSTGLRRLVRECVVRGEPTWIPYLHQNWRRERQAIEQRAAERVLRREEAERAKQAKPKAERKPKKAGAKAAPPAAGEGAPAEREGAQPEEEEEEPAESQEEAPQETPLAQASHAATEVEEEEEEEGHDYSPPLIPEPPRPRIKKATVPLAALSSGAASSSGSHQPPPRPTAAPVVAHPTGRRVKAPGLSRLPPGEAPRKEPAISPDSASSEEEPIGTPAPQRKEGKGRLASAVEERLKVAEEAAHKRRKGKKQEQ